MAFQGQLDFPRGWLKSGARIAVFGLLQGTSLVLEWALPLVPTLLITPKPQDLEIIKGILGESGAPDRLSYS